MAIQAITSTPQSADFPSLIINYDEVIAGGAWQMNCVTNKIEANFPNEFASIATFCGPKDKKPVTGDRSFRVTGWMSFDDVTASTTGFWNAMEPLQRKAVPFAALMDWTQPVGPGNPELSGRLWIPNIPPFNAPEPEQPIPFDLTFELFQAHVTTTDPAAAVAVHPLG